MAVAVDEELGEVPLDGRPECAALLLLEPHIERRCALAVDLNLGKLGNDTA